MTEAQPQTPARDQWYYLIADKHFGPVTKDVLEASLTGGSLPRTTLVWCDGLSTWVKADECALLNLTIPITVERADPPPIQPQEQNDVPTRTTGTIPIVPAVQIKRTGVWWPQSIVGSALCATFLSCLSIRVAGKCGLVAATFTNMGMSLDLILAIVGVLLNVVLGVFAYGFVVILRYSVIVAPAKRKARIEGLPWKIPFYDRLVMNPHPYTVAGFVTAAVMGASLVISQLQIANARNDIDQSENAAGGLRSSAEENDNARRKLAEMRQINEQTYDHDARNGDPFARESYLKTKTELDGMEAENQRKANSIVSSGAGYFSSALVSATTRDSLKFVQIWTLIGIVAGFSLAGYVSTQSRRAKQAR